MKPIKVDRLGDGLWRWTATRPELGIEVGCVYYESDGGRGPTVLIDPLVPPAATPDAESFYRALDRDLARTGGPLAILLTSPRHVRSSQTLLDRYRASPGATVYGLDQQRGRLPFQLLASFFPDGSRPAPGIVARAVPGPHGTETVYLLEGPPSALVTGDCVTADGTGLLALAHRPYRTFGGSGADGPAAGDLTASLSPILDWPLEAVLVSHGDPIRTGGSKALRQVLFPASGTY